MFVTTFRMRCEDFMTRVKNGWNGIEWKIKPSYTKGALKIHV